VRHQGRPGREDRRPRILIALVDDHPVHIPAGAQNLDAFLEREDRRALVPGGELVGVQGDGDPAVPVALP
jgi:hypothetical protein